MALVSECPGQEGGPWEARMDCVSTWVGGLKGAAEGSRTQEGGDRGTPTTQVPPSGPCFREQGLYTAEAGGGPQISLPRESQARVGVGLWWTPGGLVRPGPQPQAPLGKGRS